MKFMNASGCWATTEEQIDCLFQTGLDAVITKTCTWLPRVGNPEPTFYSQSGFHINSKGVPNDGYEYYKNICKKYFSMGLGKKIILSVLWETDKNNTISLLQDYNQCVGEYFGDSVLVEINLSCPNLKKEIPAYNPEYIDEIMTIIDHLQLTYLQFSLKLSPYLDHSICNKIIDVINKHAPTHIYKYIVLANSLPNCLLLNHGSPVLSTQYGGLSGKCNKPISMSNVHYFKSRIDSRVIGCGGIETSEDIEDYFQCGASAVQLGSCFYNSKTNELNYDKIRELITIMTA